MPGGGVGLCCAGVCESDEYGATPWRWRNGTTPCSVAHRHNNNKSGANEDDSKSEGNNNNNSRGCANIAAERGRG